MQLGPKVHIVGRTYSRSSSTSLLHHSIAQHHVPHPFSASHITLEAAAPAPGQHRPQRRLAQPPCSVWDESVTLADLRQKLDAAVAQEDYAAAARLRDELQ